MFTLLEKLVQAFAWVKIMISPTIIGTFIGIFAYANLNQPFGLYAGVSLSLAGLIIGIIWATRIAQKGKTIDFISRVNASPDFDITKKSE